MPFSRTTPRGSTTRIHADLSKATITMLPTPRPTGPSTTRGSRGLEDAQRLHEEPGQHATEHAQ
eukprot:1397391-Prorocentrum_lima.AAC.1